MENLENSLELDPMIEVSSVSEETNTSYIGLEKIDDKAYAGGTSIMYWM